MKEVWEGKAVEKGELVSDRRMIFKRSAVVNKKLLRELEKMPSSNLRMYSQGAAKDVFDSCAEGANIILDFISYTNFKGDLDGGMVFKDCYGEKWQVQRKYLQLAKSLLRFEYLLGNPDMRCVSFVKSSEIIGSLMCFL